MNKGLRKIAILMLALLIALAPTTAMAEQVAMKSFELSNPVITMNGVEIADLEGLKLRFSGAMEEDVFRGLVELAAGDQTAAEAALEFDGRWLNFKIDGISKAYGLPLQKMLEAQGYFPEDVNTEDIAQMLAIFEGLSAEELQAMEEESERFLQETGERLLGTAESPRTEEVAFPNGQTVTLGVADVLLTGEILKDYYKGVLQISLKNPAFAAIWELAMEETPEYAGMNSDQVVDELFDEALGGEEFPAIPLVVRYDESGEYAYITVSYTVEEEVQMLLEEWVYPQEDKFQMEMLLRMEPIEPAYAGEYIALELDALMDLEEPDFMEMDMRMHGNFNGNEGDILEFVAHEYPAGYEGREDGELYVDMFMNVDGETIGLTLSANHIPADYVKSDLDVYQASLRFLGAGSFISADGTYSQAGSEANRVYSALDFSGSAMGEEVSLYYEYDGKKVPNSLGGEDLIGAFSCGAGQEGAEVGIAMDVQWSDCLVDAQRLSFEGLDVVNVMSMTGKENEELSSEAETMTTRLMFVLLGNVPGLQELFMQSMQY